MAVAALVQFDWQVFAVRFEVAVSRENSQPMPNGDRTNQQIRSGALDAMMAAKVIILRGIFIIFLID